MKNIITSTLTIAAIVIAAQGTTAECAREDRRQVRQKARISEGVKSGELTKKEAAHLRAQQKHIKRMEKRMESDGTMTDGEKARLESAQDRASKNIYSKKHNDKTQKESSEETEETN